MRSDITMKQGKECPQTTTHLLLHTSDLMHTQSHYSWEIYQKKNGTHTLSQVIRTTSQLSYQQIQIASSKTSPFSKISHIQLLHVCTKCNGQAKLLWQLLQEFTMYVCDMDIMHTAIDCVQGRVYYVCDHGWLCM